MAPIHANDDGDAEIFKRTLWSADDDAVLIRAWLQTSRTPSGTDWDVISAHVTNNTPMNGFGRNRKSCKNRWNLITRNVTKFIGAMAQAHLRATGDTPESEVVAMANRIYLKAVKMKFTLSHAYKLLHAEPKFINYIAANKKQIFEFNLNHEESSSEEEAGAKRPRLNEGGDRVSSSNLDILINGNPSRIKSLKEQIWSSLQVLRENNVKADEWREVRLREMQISREIEELKVKKMEEKSRNNKYKILDTLLRKESLSEFDEGLKNRLCAELFPKEICLVD